MKTPLTFALLSALAASAAATAPQDALFDLRAALVQNLRVVETVCPTGLALAAPRCFEHGYPSVFDFKEALGALELEPTELWHTTTLVAGGDAGPAYSASFRTPRDLRVTLTFVEGTLLVLEAEDETP
ncbi:hypothetical protein [Truepera radiovictrix]|uniref:Uncharacterized protein n=1 Tax=Truepera radiovictrix (strain DSM 17093 / CIP 108686 / LMG 22925 / RQ-24) TaxID=649638 RepID=D7CW92_TRURR|nr:hypothetical protein [Truepera radiovictrix]ADI16042.1 conserved hypothetical protein [Truepera radiovictrix DSM 17093]WMT58330.1 hypothetical protein RCV51_05155 [Truepera radiovictrix]